MKAQILSLKEVLFEGDVKSTNVKTTSGEITILDHHQPIISVLQKGGRIILETLTGTKQTFPAHSGFLHLNSANELTVLVD